MAYHRTKQRVSWWETDNDGNEQPVIRISNDNRATFGPVLKLTSNGTIGAATQ
jgi:hypothetical protein